MIDSWSPRLSEYLDGELSPEEHGACERHLAECATCRNELHRLRQIVKRLDALPETAPPADLWPELAPRLPDRKAPTPSPTPWGRWIALAAAILLAAVLLPRWIPVSGPSEDTTDESAASDAFAYEASAAAWRGRVEATPLPDELDEARRVLLASHDRAVREVRAALRQTPGDAELEAYLARTLRMQARALARFESVVESVQ